MTRSTRGLDWERDSFCKGAVSTVFRNHGELFEFSATSDEFQINRIFGDIVSRVGEYTTSPSLFR